MNLAGKILDGLTKAIDAIQSGQRLATTTWRKTDAPCRECGGDVMRRDRIESDGLTETTLVCQQCNAATWAEGGWEP